MKKLLLLLSLIITLSFLSGCKKEDVKPSPTTPPIVVTPPTPDCNCGVVVTHNMYTFYGTYIDVNGNIQGVMYRYSVQVKNDCTGELTGKQIDIVGTPGPSPQWYDTTYINQKICGW